MVLLSALTLVALVSTVYSVPLDKCIVNNNIYEHDEIFTLPGLTNCIKYKCNHNVANMVEEGCELNSACYKVDERWTKDCRTYKCSKIVETDYTRYTIGLEDSLCKDDQGTCKKPGDIFHYKVNRVTYTQCSCTVDPLGKVRYSCTG